MLRSRWWVLIVCGLQFERIPWKDISQRKKWHNFLNSDLTHNQVKTVWKPQHAWKRWRIVRLDDESDRKILECEKQRTGLALVWTHKDIYWLVKLDIRVQGGLLSSLWFCCIFSFPHCSPGCFFRGVASCSGGYGEAAAVTSHIYTWWWQRPRKGASGSSFQKMEGGLCPCFLCLFSKQQPKQSCESVSQVTTFAQNSLVFPIYTCKNQSPFQIYRGQLDMTSIMSLPSSLTLVPFVYSVPDALVSLLFFQNSESIPILGQFAWSAVCRLHWDESLTSVKRPSLRTSI